jgi:hypothetical protein
MKNYIEILYHQSTDVPLSAVLQAARRLLMECAELGAVNITRLGPAVTIDAKVEKVPDGKFSYHIKESFSARMVEDEKLITVEQKTEESGA